MAGRALHYQWLIVSIFMCLCAGCGSRHSEFGPDAVSLNFHMHDAAQSGSLDIVLEGWPGDQFPDGSYAFLTQKNTASDINYVISPVILDLKTVGKVDESKISYTVSKSKLKAGLRDRFDITVSTDHIDAGDLLDVFLGQTYRSKSIQAGKDEYVWEWTPDLRQQSKNGGDGQTQRSDLQIYYAGQYIDGNEQSHDTARHCAVWSLDQALAHGIQLRGKMAKPEPRPTH